MFKSGDKVRFISADQNQIRWGSNDDPNGILNTETIYEIDGVEVHSWHTKVWLVGVIGVFNSVSFDFA